MVKVKHRVEQWMSIVGIITALISGILAFFVSPKNNPDNEKITTQINNLNTMSDNLKQMISFIDAQKNKMIDEEKLLGDIKQEREKIEPLLVADKKVVDAVFKLQEERQQKSIWFDRAIGFFLGITSSMIASIIINNIRKKKVNINKEQLANN